MDISRIIKVILGKTENDPFKSNKNEFSRNENFEIQKMHFFFMSNGSLNPKNRFLGQKVCSVAGRHTRK